jgi:hypothetical protein
VRQYQPKIINVEFELLSEYKKMKFQWFFIIVNSVNKDINIVAGTLPVCKECGSYLSNYTITPEERKCRRKERSLY